MNLGTIIRTCRKEKNFTQEEMANRLGVSPSAVNKWENNSSCPDILLLAPIARLLGITTDTLLSYQESLTKEEIRFLVKEAEQKMQTDSYQEGARWCLQKIREYPNCEELILALVQVMDSYRIILAQDEENTREPILALYRQLLKSSSSSIREGALQMLLADAMAKQEYDLAQTYLDQLPKQTYSMRPLMQGSLYRKTGRLTEAYQIYEQLLCTAFRDTTTALQGLFSLALEEEQDRKQAEVYASLQKQMARLYGAGAYMELSLDLELALANHDRETILSILETLADQPHSLSQMQDSSLYRHMELKKEDSSAILFMLKKGLEEDPELAFLREDPRFQTILDKFSL